MDRTVPGWQWLQGKEAQQREWDALAEDFWGYVRLNTWDVGVVRKWKTVDEQRGEVILHMEVEVLGKATSMNFGRWVDG